MDGRARAALSSPRTAFVAPPPTAPPEEAVRPRSAPPTARPPAALLAALAVAAAAACGEPRSEGDGRRAVPEPGGEPAATVTPATYRARVAFAPHAEGPAVYLRLAQTARPGRLERRYRGWRVVDGGVRPILAVDDTVPVPRAAWRPLPAPGIRVSVDRDGGLSGLGLTTPNGRVRLTVDSTLVRWSGPTGQAERLAAARVVGAGDTAAGLLLERRGARPLDAPGPRERSGLLLTAGPGPAGAAVLVSAPGRGPEPEGAGDGDGDGDDGGAGALAAAAAHGLLDGRVRSWSPIRVRRTGPDSAGWELELGEGGPLLRVRPSSAPGPAPAAVRGTLRAGGRARPVAGVIVVDPGL